MSMKSRLAISDIASTLMTDQVIEKLRLESLY